MWRVHKTPKIFNHTWWNIELYFLSYLNTQRAQKIEICPHGSQGHVSPTLSIYGCWCSRYAWSRVTSNHAIIPCLTQNIPISEPNGSCFWTSMCCIRDFGVHAATTMTRIPVNKYHQTLAGTYITGSYFTRKALRKHCNHVSSYTESNSQLSIFKNLNVNNTFLPLFSFTMNLCAELHLKIFPFFRYN